MFERLVLYDNKVRWHCQSPVAGSLRCILGDFDKWSLKQLWLSTHMMNMRLLGKYGHIQKMYKACQTCPFYDENIQALTAVSRVRKKMNKPLLNDITIEITNHCQLHCQHCGIWAEKERHEMTASMVVRMMRELLGTLQDQFCIHHRRGTVFKQELRTFVKSDVFFA